MYNRVHVVNEDAHLSVLKVCVACITVRMNELLQLAMDLVPPVLDDVLHPHVAHAALGVPSPLLILDLLGNSFPQLSNLIHVGLDELLQRLVVGVAQKMPHKGAAVPHWVLATQVTLEKGAINAVKLLGVIMRFAAFIFDLREVIFVVFHVFVIEGLISAWPGTSWPR